MKRKRCTVLLMTASTLLLLSRGEAAWTGLSSSELCTQMGQTGMSMRPPTAFCSALSSGCTHFIGNRRVGRSSDIAGLNQSGSGSYWAPCWSDVSLSRQGAGLNGVAGRSSVTRTTMALRGVSTPRSPLWSIAGLRIAGAQILAPLTKVVTPQNLLFFVVFQIVYARLLRLLYKLQVKMWRIVRKHDPAPYEGSVLGFLEPRLRMLSRALVVGHLLNSVVRVSIASGWDANPKLAKLLSDVVYCWYAGYFVDEAKRFFLPVWIPSLKSDKRKAFIYNRSLSVLIWSSCALSVSEVVSAYLRIPITSTLAFGGIGGLAIGLAGKDVLSNFFGGLTLLFAEPFIPGDMVTFQRSGVICEGRVERVGWYQTRMRGRDTRPTYVPNGMFADTMVTNMDRITHRKFESSFQIRYDDASKVPEILQGIKAALKDVPNVDLLSRPFRVHLTEFTESGLKITIVCYFATKSFDEFLYLQQLSLLEVTRVVQSAKATMTSVLYVDMVPSPIPVGKVEDTGTMRLAVASQVPTRERDGLITTFEEQDSARKINLSIEGVSRSAPKPANKVQEVKPHAAVASQVPTREHDGLVTTFEEQDSARKINLSIEGVSRSAPKPANKVQEVKPHAAVASQVPTRERDGSITTFEEQDSAREINPSFEGVSRSALKPANKVQEVKPHTVVASQVPTRERDGLNTTFEEQDSARKVKVSIEDTKRAKPKRRLPKKK